MSDEGRTIWPGPGAHITQKVAWSKTPQPPSEPGLYHFTAGYKPEIAAVVGPAGIAKVPQIIMLIGDGTHYCVDEFVRKFPMGKWWPVPIPEPQEPSNYDLCIMAAMAGLARGDESTPEQIAASRRYLDLLKQIMAKYEGKFTEPQEGAE